MRKLIALVASTAALLVAGTANAATVDLFLKQGSVANVATNDWALTMNVNAALDIAGVAFQISNGGIGSLVLAQGATVIEPLPPGLSNYVVSPGMVRVGLASGSQGFISSGIVANFAIGTFTGPGPVALIDCNPGDCPAIILTDESDVQDYLLHTTPFVPVPEPGALLLLGIGLGALSLARRKSA